MKSIFNAVSLLCLVTYASAQSISPSLLAEFESQDKVDCIIVMDDQLDLYGKTKGMTKTEKAKFVFNNLEAHATRHQENLLAELNSLDIAYQSFHIFNGIQAYLTKVQAEYLLLTYPISTIVYNQPAMMANVQKRSPNTIASREAEWGVKQINADSVWRMGYTGQGVTIGGQDTGYDFDNPLILPKYRGIVGATLDHNYNWHDAIFELNPLHMDTINDPSLNPCGFLSPEPCDDFGHGSYTMGIMTGGDDENEIGVAPDASWIGCRNMDRGYGKPSTYTECFEWFLAPTDISGLNPDFEKAPHVINNSWGCPPMEGCDQSNWEFMETVVNNLSASGIVVVVSAGNDGNDGCNSIRNPSAIFENSFVVGATNDQDLKAGFSSIGPVTIDSSFRIKPDVVAPGVGIRSIWLNEQLRSLNGTSAAGPHVAATVALMISANQDLAGRVDEIKEILKSTAVPLVDSTVCNGNMALDVPNFFYGYGRIDALAAVQRALQFTSTKENETLDGLAYPNPNSGIFVVESPHDLNPNEVTIIDINGRIVGSKVRAMSDHSVEIQIAEKGVFFYRINGSKGAYTGKIVITD